MTDETNTQEIIVATGPLKDNQPSRKMWSAEAEETLSLLWGKCEPYIIARIINAWLVRVFLVERKHKSAPLFTGNSIIDHAFRMGIIDEPTMIEMKKVERKEHRLRMKEAMGFVQLQSDNTVYGRLIADFEPRSSFTYLPLDTKATP